MDYWGDTTGDAGTVQPMEHPTGASTVDIAYAGEFGGYAGSERERHASPVGWAETEQGGFSDGWWGQAVDGAGVATDGVDWSAGGTPACPTDLPYSIGPVDPSYVENQELTGRVVRPGRDAEEGAGPVGATEYRSNLIMQIVQAMGPEVTDEMAAIGLISGV